MSNPSNPLVPDLDILKIGLQCRCPKCRQGLIYQSRFSLAVRDSCEICGFDLANNDSADGPAVFLIFILGFLLVPLALFLEFTLYPPLWVHAVLWSVVILGLTIGALKPLKAYIIALQYKHRRSDWN